MPDPEFRAYNGIRTSWLPIKIDSEPQAVNIGDAKILLVTEGPESSKTLNVYYEVDSNSYGYFSNREMIFHVVGVAERVPEGTSHVGSVLLRDGNVFHIYREVQERKSNV